MQQFVASFYSLIIVFAYYLTVPVNSCLPWGCYGVSCVMAPPVCVLGLCLPGIGSSAFTGGGYMGCPCRTGMSCVGGTCVFVARGAKTFREGEHDETPDSALKNPNEQFLSCCQAMALPHSCHTLCSFEGYTKQAIQNSLSFTPDSCPVTSLSTVHFCASRGVDHTQCCEEAGIASECKIFCNQRQNTTNSLLSLSHLQCLTKFDDIKGCFLEHALMEYYEAHEAIRHVNSAIQRSVAVERRLHSEEFPQPDSQLQHIGYFR